ncbi:outer membrane beta-barrel protein [Novosphingobium sp.]|uniref:outer membrane beta-barrel protein n=1 Tax=Novosphingobium sp. TaxID=1874826 RepID=UPI0025DFF0DA|nr:outer membrane beta-barrel protein [Novosphingobium sp.]
MTNNKVANSHFYIRAAILAGAIAFIPLAAHAQSVGGAHVEVQGGYDHLSIPDQTGTAPAGSTGGGHGIYGFGAGYDVALAGHVIAGVDANLDFGAGSQCASGVVAASDQLCSKLRNDFDVGARLGYQAGPALLYGRVAFNDTHVRSSYTDPLGNVTTARGSQQGVRLGVGGEYGLGGGAYLKTEYRYTPSSQLGDQQQVIGGIGLHF